MKSLCFAKRAGNVVLFVWSSCHQGCQREGSDSKRDGWVPCFIICHFGKNSAEAIFRTRQLYFSHHPCYNTKKTLAYNIALNILSSVLTRLSS